MLKNIFLRIVPIFIIIMVIGTIIFDTNFFGFQDQTHKNDGTIANNTSSLPKKPQIAKTDKTKTDLYNKEVIHKRAGVATELEGIDTELPNKDIFALAGKNEKDLTKWLDILPEQDRDEEEYLVLPNQGLIVPLHSIDKTHPDYISFTNGEEIDSNKYLENGVFEIPGTSINHYGEPGNKVISGHSSYFSDSPGRYKTHFQKIITMNAGDPIWIYTKHDDIFVRYVYITEKSYNTSADDISILGPTDEKIVTLFTCTPIGGIDGRWIVQGKFLGKYED